MTHPRTQTVLLGTGTPNAEPDKHGMSIAVMVDDVPYLLDAGPGVVRRAAAAHRDGVSGLAMANLSRVFLTHLHHDHTLGLPDLLLTPWTLGRSEPLTVYGPTGTNALVNGLLAAYDADITERLHGLEPSNTTGYAAAVTVFDTPDSAVIYSDERVTITAIRVRHGRWPAYAFKLETPDRTILYSGDTAPVPILREHPCDLLVHEVYSVAGFAGKSPEWQAYHGSVHTSAHELGELAAHLQPETVILVHQLGWGTSPDALVAEVRERFDGEVVYGRDLDVYS